MMHELGIRAERARVAKNGTWLFAANFLKHPYMLGSILPSSRHLVDRVLKPIEWQRTRVLVEYGPGVGTFTAEILARMRPDSHLLAIESNSDFVRHLRATLPDRRLHVEQGSAADVEAILEHLALPSPRYVISGIPLGSMPVAARLAICRASRTVLESDGAFLVYQFTSRVLPQLQETFTSVEREFHWQNLPPARYYACR